MNRERTRTILALALPIMGGMVSQNVLNLVDMAMVGTLGDNALAGVGIGGFRNFVAMSLVMGLSSGVQAIASRRLGEGRLDQTAVPLNGGLLMALTIGLPMGGLLFFLAPLLFHWLKDDPAAAAHGVPYLQARLCGAVAVGMNYSFRGYFNGVKLSKLYLQTLLIMHASNIVISACLIFGLFGAPKLGSTGAGVGSAIATYIGTGYYFYLGFRHARPNGFLKRLPTKTTLTALMRLSLPTMVQTLFFALGFSTLFLIIGKIGTAEQAAATILVNILLVALLPGIGLGMAGATLVGQSLGKSDPDDAYRWGLDVLKVATLVMLALGLPMILIPDLVLTPFLHNAETRALALTALRLIGVATVFEATTRVFMNALLGAGDSRRVMLVSMGSQWLLYLPAAYLFGPHLGYGLEGVWGANLGYALLQAIFYTMLWRGDHWRTIEV